jgi:hypothetical protein
MVKAALSPLDLRSCCFIFLLWALAMLFGFLLVAVFF